MIAAQHNCSNQNDSRVGSGGSAKWSKQMATKRKMSKQNIHLGFQFKALIHILADQINFSKTAHFCCKFISHMFSDLLFLTFLSLLENTRQRHSLKKTKT